MKHARGTAGSAAALIALATLLAGLGALGWTAGHLVTYGALGREHAHGSHGYLAPLLRTGFAGACAGIALALLALAVGRHALVDLVQRSRSRVPWLVAGTLPATSFALVELLESSVPRVDLLLVGLPLQLILGALVLGTARLLVLGLVRAVDHLVAQRWRPGRLPRDLVPTTAMPTLVRRAPMASSAPRRGPPVRPT